jgi:hypothetical protein
MAVSFYLVGQGFAFFALKINKNFEGVNLVKFLASDW